MTLRFGFLALPAVLVLTLSSAAASVPASTFELPLKGVHTIEVINPSGDIHYSGSSDAKTGKVKISVDSSKFAPHCELEHRREGDRLILEVRSTKAFSVNDCKGEVAVEALQMIQVRLHSGNGNMKVEHVSSPLEFEIGNGTFSAKDVMSNDLRGTTGNGNIELAYTKAPSRARVSLGTGNGDVKIQLPAGTPIDLDQEAGVGQVTNALGNTPNAAIQIHVQSGVGKTEIVANP